MSYIGVYKAIYSYAATTSDELSMEENDLLYLLEKSDIDDWWKVKKRLVGSDVDEPSGLVPSTYIEPAPSVGSAVALYSYTKQTEEELSFSENDQFIVYDTQDVDWILVGTADKSAFGFVPANYIEITQSASGNNTNVNKALPAAPIVNDANAKAELAQYGRPPQRNNDTSRQRALSRASVKSYVTEDDDDIPPAKPKRPNGPTISRDRVTNDDIPRTDRDDFDDSRLRDPKEMAGVYTWQVAEVEGKKKLKNTLGIGNGKIYLNPEPSTGGEPRNWNAEYLISFSAEKKHVFLDFKKPPASIELHVGSKDTAREILALLGEISGAISTSALNEIKNASKPTANGYRTAQVAYDFVGQNKDELSVKEGDLVYIVNDKKSPDWWLVENIDTGKRGVIPSSYVSVGGEEPISLSSAGRKTKSKSSEREREKERDRHRDSERSREKEKERERRKSTSGSSKSKAKPNPHKSRTWVDKSGSFRVEAEFLGCVEGKIHLHKANGVKIAVAADKLSLADIEYVERVTGFSLDKYKSKKKERSSSTSEKRSSNGNRSRSKSKKSYDWFEFFLNCGVDLNQCQRYESNFEREQLDESSLEDINASLLRNLGLREGDIIRVMRFLDKKFDRTKELTPPLSAPDRSNSTRSKAPKIDANNLAGADDDAWTIKPSATQAAPSQAAPQQNTQQPAAAPMKPAITGSLQDLVDLKPLDANYTSSSTNPLKNKTSVPAIQPTKTGSSITLGSQKTGSSINLNSLIQQKTGGSVKSQKTGGTMQPLDPFKTGGHNLLPMTTGAPVIFPMATGAGTSVIVPIQTMQPVLIGQPTTTFSTNTTTGSLAPLKPIRTGGIAGNITGITATVTGAMPQTSFMTTIPVTNTGISMVPTGGINMTTTGGMQMTGGAMPMQTTFGNTPMTSFGTGAPQMQMQMPMTSFGAQPMQQQQPMQNLPQTSFGMNNLTNMMQNTGINPMQQQMTQQQTGLMQGMSSLQMLQNLQQQAPQQQQQPNLFTNTFSPNGGQMPQTSFSPNVGQLPQTSFSPLTAQPTGFGFGNGPSLQPQQTGKQASLANATPDNPFGF